MPLHTYNVYTLKNRQSIKSSLKLCFINKCLIKCVHPNLFCNSNPNNLLMIFSILTISLSSCFFFCSLYFFKIQTKRNLIAKCWTSWACCGHQMIKAETKGRLLHHMDKSSRSTSFINHTYLAQEQKIMLRNKQSRRLLF